MSQGAGVWLVAKAVDFAIGVTDSAMTIRSALDAGLETSNRLAPVKDVAGGKTDALGSAVELEPFAGVFVDDLAVEVLE